MANSKIFWAPRITYVIGKDVVMPDLYEDRDEAREIAEREAEEENRLFAEAYSTSGGLRGLNRAFGDVKQFKLEK